MIWVIKIALIDKKTNTMTNKKIMHWVQIISIILKWANSIKLGQVICASLFVASESPHNDISCQQSWQITNRDTAQRHCLEKAATIYSHQQTLPPQSNTFETWWNWPKRAKINFKHALPPHPIDGWCLVWLICLRKVLYQKRPSPGKLCSRYIVFVGHGWHLHLGPL